MNNDPTIISEELQRLRDKIMKNWDMLSREMCFTDGLADVGLAYIINMIAAERARVSDAIAQLNRINWSFALDETERACEDDILEVVDILKEVESKL